MPWRPPSVFSWSGSAGPMTDRAGRFAKSIGERSRSAEDHVQEAGGLPPAGRSARML